MQVVIELFFQKITDEFVDGRSVGSHVARAEFGFGLGLEYGFFHLDADSRHHAVANVGIFEVFGVKFFDGTRDGFFECREMRPPKYGVLPVDERIKFFSILVVVGDNDLDVVAFEMYHRVERRSGHLFVEQVDESVFGRIAHAVVDKRETRIEVGIIFDEGYDEFFSIFVIDKNRIVGLEAHPRSVTLIGRGDSAFFGFVSAGVSYAFAFALSVGFDTKFRRKGIYGFDTYTVEADRFFKCL